MVAEGRNAFSPWTLLRVVLRALWIQSCWNFRGMQNLGFAYAIGPVIKALYLAKTDRARALQRHIEFFNTHPYCSAIILGVVAQMEQTGRQQHAVTDDDISRIKTGMMGPLAALGDTVFWASLKPALALGGVALVLTARPHMFWQDLAGVGFFLILYSLPHLGLRVGGVFWGYHRGLMIVQDLRKFNPQLIARRLTFFLAIVCGAFLVIYPLSTMALPLHEAMVPMLGFMGLTAVFVLLFKRGLSVEWLLYALILIMLCLAWAGWL